MFRFLASVLCLISLSLIEFTALATEADSDLAARWKLDETSGMLIKDSGPNHADGLLSSQDVRATDSVGGYLELTGNNKGVAAVPFNPAVRFETTDFTISFWVAPPRIQDGRQRLIYSDGCPKGWWCVDLESGCVQLQVGFMPAGAASPIVANPSTRLRLSEGRWNHVVIGIDRKSSKVIFYLNGKLDASCNFDKGMSGSIWPGPTGLYIGQPDGQRAEGRYSDFRIYNRLLTSEEATASYASNPRKDLRTRELVVTPLAPLFQDHMVLQRGKSVPIYGEAPDGADVMVSFGGQTKSTKAANGHWRINLNPMKAEAAGRDLTVSVRDSASGKSTETTLHDVVVGEVWLASGQSNMQWPLVFAEKLAWGSPVPEANHPDIRFLVVAMNAASENKLMGNWKVCTPSAASTFSAVAYYFARDLQKDLKVPVGIIGSYWGGTRIESWMSPDTFAEDLAFAKAQSDYAKGPNSDGNPQDVPAALFKAMIEPLIPYAIQGALWYQGESNSGESALYIKQLKAMVEDWRAKWGEGSFPFMVVQLPRFTAPHWPPFRDAQWAATRQTSNTGLIVTIDTGSMTEIHPNDKVPVGERLSLWARANVYGEKIVYTGPEFSGLQVKGNKAIVRYDHVGSGLKAVAKDLPGFELRGADDKWTTGTAVIKGGKVVVTSAAVSNPTAVRYAWSDNPPASLGNREGFPAAPFSSDTFVPKKAERKWGLGFLWAK